MYSHFTLSNGIRVGVFSMDSVKSVAVKAMLTAGPILEDENTWGASHFIEHIVLSGTKSFPNKKMFAEKLEEYGVSYNGYTATQEMAFEFDVPYTNLIPTLDVLKEVLFFPGFDPVNVEKERKVILEEMQDRQNSPDFQYYYTCLEHRYEKNHPLTRQVIGTKEVISFITTQSLKSFYEKLFIPKNIYICIVGNVNIEETKEYLEKEFGSLGDRQAIVVRPKYSMDDLSGFTVKGIENSKFTNVYNMISFPGFAQEMPEKTELALRLFSIMFGGLRTSKLFQDVRENEGLVYSIGADWTASWGIGTFNISFEADAANIPRILDIVFKDIKEVKEYQIDVKHLEHIKKYLTNRMLLGFSTPWKINQWIFDYLFEDKKVVMPEDLITKVNAITLDDVKQVVDKIFDMDNMNVIMMGKLEGYDPRKQLVKRTEKSPIIVKKGSKA